jgi:predicted nucleic acid-binding protein
MRAYRIYMDTSTLGGYYDEEFAESTRTLFQAVFDGKIHALISDTLVTELIEAPVQVQELLEKVINHGCERLVLTPDVEELRDAYLSAGVVTPKYSDDALHVAHATMSRADVIVSWNFKHLVNPFRVKGFNTVNMEQGYGSVIIMTPSDIVKTMEETNEEEQNI